METTVRHRIANLSRSNGRRIVDATVEGKLMGVSEGEL